jgi:hypothetical protein
MELLFSGSAADSIGVGTPIAPFAGGNTSDFEVYGQHVDRGVR